MTYIHINTPTQKSVDSKHKSGNGRRHEKLGRFIAHDPVRRGCDQTNHGAEKTKSVEMKSDKVR